RTLEGQSVVGSVRISRMTAYRTSFAGVVRIDFDSHTARSRGFVGDVAVQFSKRPRGGMPVHSALLSASLLASFSLAAFADVCQVFQSDDAVWVRLHNASTDQVVAILFQPSLSSANIDQASCGGTSAFLLQAFSQSRIMVRFGSDLFA